MLNFVRAACKILIHACTVLKISDCFIRINSSLDDHTHYDHYCELIRRFESGNCKQQSETLQEWIRLA